MYCLVLVNALNLVNKCDPLCENQAKVSKSNYEITSIKVWFQPLIPVFDMALLSHF